ncbi:hypothetical protein [Parasediminibacterium sp. JCM 36343]|uniref:hypothetical protein n=1 Tax=Parasediminibacterium sp. JCM 36343 TaxID=3374279 RepID=UPI0039788BD7
MFAFLKKIFLFILILAIFDYMIGQCLHYIYFSQKRGQFAQTTYSLDSSNQDILVFGNSRAARHYSSAILSDSLHKTCYNLGMDAQGIIYATALQEVIFNRHKPSMVILNINAWEFDESPVKYERLSVFLPYCKEHPELIKYIKLSSPAAKWELLSNVYTYNSTFFTTISNLSQANNLPKIQGGYDPMIKKMNATEIAFVKKKIVLQAEENRQKPPKIDTIAFSYYSNFLKKCVDNHIPTYVIISPTLVPEEQSKGKEKLIEITQSFPTIKFMDFSSDPDYNGHFEKFADFLHLNKEGAEAFTKKLAAVLK